MPLPTHAYHVQPTKMGLPIPSQARMRPTERLGDHRRDGVRGTADKVSDQSLHLYPRPKRARPDDDESDPSHGVAKRRRLDEGLKGHDVAAQDYHLVTLEEARGRADGTSVEHPITIPSDAGGKPLALNTAQPRRVINKDVIPDNATTSHNNPSMAGDTRSMSDQSQRRDSLMERAERYVASPEQVASPPDARDFTPKSAKDKETALTNDLRSFLRSTIRRFKNDDRYSVFRTPVDINDYPDYHKIISNVVDLNDVENRLKARCGRRRYNTLEDFRNDFDLILANSATYNGPDNLVTKRAVAMQRELKRRLEDCVAAGQTLRGSKSRSSEDRQPDYESDDESVPARRTRGSVKRAQLEIE